ncbi:MAG: hypothetical protein LAO20_08650 [Acidobacteriia bacterium]|nr:hypothetical protein [Terriglobia bacterium]
MISFIHQFVKNKNRLLLMSVLALLGLAQAARAQSPWQVEVVEGGDGRNLGKFSSLSIDSHDNLHIGYYDETRQALRYAFRSASVKRWDIMEVDASGGFESLAVDNNGHPHFAYAGPNESGLRYAFWDGKKWTKQTLDYEHINFFNFIRIAPNGQPRISYYHRLYKDGTYALHLKYAFLDGGTWYTETVDSRSATGKFNSLALDSKGLPHIAYSDVDAGDLRYASWDGSEWHFGAPDTHQMSGGWTGLGGSIEIDQAGNPHIAYFDVAHRMVKYASWTAQGGWKSEVVDNITGRADNIERVSLKFDSKQRPHVAYWDSGMGVLRYATITPKGWKAETVDNGNNVGLDPSLAIDSHDDIYISYYDMAHTALRLAHKRAAVAAPQTRAETVKPQP